MVLLFLVKKMKKAEGAVGKYDPLRGEIKKRGRKGRKEGEKKHKKSRKQESRMRMMRKKTEDQTKMVLGS